MFMSLFKLSLRSVDFEQFYKSWDGKKLHLFLSGAQVLIKSSIKKALVIAAAEVNYLKASYSLFHI